MELDCEPQLVNWQPLSGGASSQVFRFQCDSLPLPGNDFIIRLAHEGEVFAAGLTKQQESRIQQAAATAGIRTPAVLHSFAADSDLRAAYISPFISGDSDPISIIRRCQQDHSAERLLQQCASQLAAIHALDTGQQAFLPGTDTEKQVLALQAEYQRYRQTLPVFSLAFRWLRDHLPAPCKSVVLHGDFRNGNLLVDAEELCSILDWELAHCGDPAEDLAWFCAMPWRFGYWQQQAGGLASRETFFQAYERAAGHTLSRARLHFWEVYAILRWGIICLYQCDVHMRGVEHSLERLAIGRRIAECEMDLISLLEDAT